MKKLKAFLFRQPQHHFNIVKNFCRQKHVFVEKPPCTSIDELNELISIEENEVQCLVGFKKICSFLHSACKTKYIINTYNYRFHIGAYPEGNIFTNFYSSA